VVRIGLTDGQSIARRSGGSPVSLSDLIFPLATSLTTVIRACLSMDRLSTLPTLAAVRND
jgi:hypothetical protein